MGMVPGWAHNFCHEGDYLAYRSPTDLPPGSPEDLSADLRFPIYLQSLSHAGLV